METKEIVVVLTNKGYVAIECDQIFDLWKNKSLKVIYEELQERYPSFKIHLGSLDLISFNRAVEVSNKYLIDHEELKYVQSQNINFKINSKMKHLSFNAETARTIAKVTAGFTTQKVFGAIHLTVQTGADVLQSTANTIVKGEASILTRLGLYNESFNDLIKIRKDRTKGYQKAVKQVPSKLQGASSIIRIKMENLLTNHKTQSINSQI